MTVTSTLNADQQKASDEFFKFLLGDEKEFIISGPGGVGKTHLMSSLIDTTLPRYIDICKVMDIDPLYTGVQMTATTNKASEVLAVATNRPTSTLHSYLNLKVKDNYQTGEQEIAPTSNYRIHQNMILFVDECSMIDTPLNRYILDTMHKSKIVYVGDHCQLAPIKETISPVFKKEKPFVQLTIPMRNNGQPALMAVCNQLRTTVETGVFNPIKIVPGVIDLLDNEQMAKALDDTFRQQTYESRILAYTNQRVIAYNDHIRHLRGLPAHFTVGERLINNNAIQLPGRMVSVEEELTVLAVSDTTEQIFIDNDANLEVRRYTLESRIGDVFTDIMVPVDRNHFKALVSYYGKHKRFERYFYLKNTFPDLRPRDAATVHKSQGSTYDSVFIDLANISTCHQPNAVARMLYVAFTRARHRIYLYGDLASKYGGLTR